MFSISCKTLGTSKKDVPGIVVTLRLHPDEITITDKQKNVHYIFFSLEQKCLVISSKKDIFEAIQNHLPAQNISGNSVTIEATSIAPFVDFDKDQLSEISKRIGLKLNEFKVYKLFNYSLSTGQQHSSGKNVLPPPPGM